MKKNLLFVPVLLALLVTGCDSQGAAATVTARAANAATVSVTLTVMAGGTPQANVGTAAATSAATALAGETPAATSVPATTATVSAITNATLAATANATAAVTSEPLTLPTMAPPLTSVPATNATAAATNAANSAIALPTMAVPLTTVPNTLAATLAATTASTVAPTVAATMAATAAPTTAVTAVPTMAATQTATQIATQASATGGPASQHDVSWFQQGGMYSLFVRSFRDSNGDGIGDLQGVIDGLDYLQGLSVNTIWLLPVFKSPSYHGYDVSDYYTVNPDYGTNDDLKNLIKEVHKRGMHILLDFVANHTSNQHPYFKDAFQNPQSQYSDFYLWNAPDHSSYQTFSGVQEMPKLNYDSPKVRKYMTDVALYWMDPNKDGNLSEGVDGYRCDVAVGPPASFWQELRSAMTAKNPKSLLLGELWTDVRTIATYLKGDQFDAAFDFPTYTALAGSNDKNGTGPISGDAASTLIGLNLRAAIKLYAPSAQLVRFINNHDTNRVMSNVGGDILRGKMAAVWLFTAPGVPAIYYGEEIGMMGSKSPAPAYDETRREPLDWYTTGSGKEMTTWFKRANPNNKPSDGISVEEEDKEPGSLLQLYRNLGKLRATTPALQGNDYDLPLLTGDQAPLYLLRRWDGKDLYIVLINFTKKDLKWIADDSSFTVGTDAAKQQYNPSTGQAIMRQNANVDSDGNVILAPAGYVIFKFTRQ